MNKYASILAATGLCVLSSACGESQLVPEQGAVDASDFLPGSDNSQDGEDSTTVTWLGECQVGSHDRYRMVLVGSNKGTFSVSGQDGDGLHSESGKYRASEQKIEFGNDQAEVLGYDSMACSVVKGLVTVADITTDKYLECALAEDNNIAFFGDCNQVRFVAETQPVVIGGNEHGEELPHVDTDTPVILPPDGTLWPELDDDREDGGFDALLTGTCVNDAKERPVTFSFTDDGQYAASLVDDHDTKTMSGTYEFDGKTLKLEEDGLSQGACSVKEHGVVRCNLTETAELSFFGDCNIVELRAK